MAVASLPVRVVRFEGVARIGTRCATCNLRELCLPCGLKDDSPLFDEMVYSRRRVPRGSILYWTGAVFDSLYAVRGGFFKSRILLEDGREQVTGFHMAGEVIGSEGVGTERHATDVIALEDSDVCVIPYHRLERPGLQRQVQKVMGRELVRGHGVMTLLGSMSAEERLAAFLLNLSQRFAARGYSASEFHLRMTRGDIGSYLGLSLETVCRLLKQFRDRRLICVEQKRVRITDMPGLQAVVGGIRTGCR